MSCEGEVTGEGAGFTMASEEIGFMMYSIVDVACEGLEVTIS